MASQYGPRAVASHSAQPFSHLLREASLKLTYFVYGGEKGREEA